MKLQWFLIANMNFFTLFSKIYDIIMSKKSPDTSFFKNFTRNSPVHFILPYGQLNFY